MHRRTVSFFFRGDGFGGVSSSFFENISAIREELGSVDGLMVDLQTLGDRAQELRRIKALRPPNIFVQDKKNAPSLKAAPASPLFVTDGKESLYERGWNRSVIFSRQQMLLSSPLFPFQHHHSKNNHSHLTRREVKGCVSKVSDMQLHEIDDGNPIILTQMPLRISRSMIASMKLSDTSENGEKDTTKKSNFKKSSDLYFHFILHRQRLSLLNAIQFLSSRGNLPLEAFAVSVYPPDASGTVTQRLSVRCSDMKVIDSLLTAANGAKQENETRLCRLQPIGFRSEPCFQTPSQLLRYTVFMRGVTCSPRRSLVLANAALRDAPGVANYFNPLSFGGTQPLAALSSLHRAVKEGSLEGGLGMLLALAGRSGWLGRQVKEVALSLKKDPLSLTSIIKKISSESRTSAFAPWFIEAISLAHSPSESVSLSELHELFHSSLPHAVKRSIKYSTPMLAWNASASVIIDHYKEENKRLPLPELDVEECDVGINERFYKSSHNSKGGSVDGRFDIPLLSLPWDIRGDTPGIPERFQRPLTSSGVGIDELGRVVLPVGFHPFEESPCNVGLVAVDGVSLVGNSSYGFRPLFVSPQDVACFVCYRGDTPTDVTASLLTDTAGVGAAKPLGDSKELFSRIPRNVLNTHVVADRPRDVTDRSIPHNLILQFALPCQTDPSAALMPFAHVRSDLPFVPEDNGLHLSMKLFDEGEGVRNDHEDDEQVTSSQCQLRSVDSASFVYGDGNLLGKTTRLRSKF